MKSKKFLAVLSTSAMLATVAAPVTIGLTTNAAYASTAQYRAVAVPNVAGGKTGALGALQVSAPVNGVDALDANGDVAYFALPSGFKFTSNSVKTKSQDQQARWNALVDTTNNVLTSSAKTTIANAAVAALPSGVKDNNSDIATALGTVDLSAAVTLDDVKTALTGASVQAAIDGLLPSTYTAQQITDAENAVFAAIKSAVDQVDYAAAADVVIDVPGMTPNGKVNPLQESDLHIDPAKITSNEFQLSLNSAPSNTLTAAQRTAGLTLDSVAYFTIYYNKVQIPNSSSSNVNVTISADPNLNDAFSNASVTIATTSAGSAFVTADDSTTSISDGGQISKIYITENSVGALKQGNAIKLTLPNGFSWVWTGPNAPVVTKKFGDQNAGARLIPGADSRTAYLYVDTPTTSAMATYVIQANVSIDDSVAKFGDVHVAVDAQGDNSVNTSDLVVGKYSDFGVTVNSVTTKPVWAGHAAQKIGEFTIAENAVGTLVGQRNITLTLPQGVTWATVPTVTVDSGDNINLGPWTLVGNDGRTIKATVLSSSSNKASTLHFKDAKINVDGPVTGDINVTVGGTEGFTGTVKVATSTAPVTASVSKVANVQIGAQNQDAGDIVIKEADKGLLAQGKEIVVTLPQGVRWAGYNVAVTAGDLVIDNANIQKHLNSSGKWELHIPVKYESTQPSTITISGVKYTLDRTVPEGPFNITVDGSAIDQAENATSADYANIDSNGNWVLDGANVASGQSYALGNQIADDMISGLQAANVVTPAPGEQHATVKFVIGQNSYTVNNVTTQMDVAPYIKNGRTYLPVHFVANALGVSDQNIIWDGANRTVTLFAQGKVVQLKIGSNIMTVNGAPITMDVAPEIQNGRTMLPVSFVASALGYSATWDGSTQTVTLQ
jgi:hypothetical protein